jgi:putative oxidoreductase
MKKSRIMSPTKTPTSPPLLPTLPIEVWFEAWPLYTWSAAKDEDDYVFKFCGKDKSEVRGTPSPKLAVGGTGVILLLGGLSMLLGVYPVVGIILLIVFLLGVSLQMHAYWKVDDAQMKQIDMINFTKNMALVGALLMFLLLPHPWPMSLGIG